MGSWRLANRKPPDGALPDVDRFESIAAGGALRARRISVPTEIDVQRALENAGGLASDCTRSLEFWWDGPGHRLDIVLVAARDDMPAYEQDFTAAYVNAAFEDSPTSPAWYDRTYYVEEAAFVMEGGGARRAAVPRGAGPESDGADEAGAGGSGKKRRTHAGLRCMVFDLGYRHGHFMSAFDVNTKHDTVTQVSSVMQLAQYGWMQMVFRRNSFTRQLQDLSRNMRSMHKEFAETEHYSSSDMMFSTDPKPREHPEKKADFATHHKELQSHLTQKSQDEQVMVSVRGLLETRHDVALDWSGICSAPSGGRSIEHLMMNEYGYAGFVGLQKGRGNGGRKSKGGGGGSAWWRRGRSDDSPVHAVPTIEPPDGGAGPAGVDAESAAMAAAAAVAGRWRPRLTFRIDGRKNKECTRLRIFEDRLLPDASEIDRPASKYLSKSFLLGRYGTRRSPPFVIMTLQELGLLLRLPDTSATPNLTITRQQVMPQQP